MKSGRVLLGGADIATGYSGMTTKCIPERDFNAPEAYVFRKRRSPALPPCRAPFLGF